MYIFGSPFTFVIVVIVIVFSIIRKNHNVKNKYDNNHSSANSYKNNFNHQEKNVYDAIFHYGKSDIYEIARSTSLSEEDVIKIATTLIRNGQLNGYYYNPISKSIETSNRQNSSNNYPRAQTSNHSKPTFTPGVIKCPNCGASNYAKTPDAVCAYCGGHVVE